MPILRNGLIAGALAVLASGAAVAATQATGSAASPAPARVSQSGIATLHKNIDLPPSSWTNIPLQVRLPCAGTYEVDADVRGRLQGYVPLNTYITARLWNVTANREAIYSDRLIYQLINFDNPTPTYAIAGNQTAPISELIRVYRPTVIRLQAESVNATGMASIAQIYSDGAGYTTLRYERVFP